MKALCVSLRIGVDTGGTFTDIVAHDTQSGRLHTFKTPSTPEDPACAILTGLKEGQELGLWQLSELTTLVHGTTVATNALLERRGATTAFITTAGFRDVLEIQRQNRPQMYDLRSRRPRPLVPRHLRLEIQERVLVDGTIEKPLDRTELDRVISEIAAGEVEAVVIGLLHSHTNPIHEILVAEAVTAQLPGVSVCTSHEIAGEPGEFERFSTAAANGYVQPVVEGYLNQLESRLNAAGVTAPVFVMKSSGGAGTAQAVSRRCVETAVSGPAGGVRASVELAQQVDGGNLIAADMGGTSFDVAVVTAGTAQLAREATIGGLPIRIPMLDIHTIGAGGGSIGWIDAGGAMRVGPHSAGASPGPVCYGRGGSRPTVTDANLVLGRLTPDSRLAGGMRLDEPAAREAIQNELALPLALSVEQAALGMVRVANAAMVAALRKVTVERGIDPRGYTLCPYGGAGPLHAAELATELGAKQVIVPTTPGVFSARGLVLSDLREDRFASLVEPLTEEIEPTLERLSAELTQQAMEVLQQAGKNAEPSVSNRQVALRYKGQSSPLELAWPVGQGAAWHALSAGFHDAHRKRFGFARIDQPLEVVSLSLSVELSLAMAPNPAPEERGNEEGRPDRRLVWFESGSCQAEVRHRESLQPGLTLEGPVIVEQDDTTTVIPPNWRMFVQDSGDLLLEARP